MPLPNVCTCRNSGTPRTHVQLSKTRRSKSQLRSIHYTISNYASLNSYFFSNLKITYMPIWAQIHILMRAKRGSYVSFFSYFVDLLKSFNKLNKLENLPKRITCLHIAIEQFDEYFLGTYFRHKNQTFNHNLNLEVFNKIEEMPFANYATTFPLCSRRATSMYLFLPEPAEQSCAAAAEARNEAVNGSTRL